MIYAGNYFLQYRYEYRIWGMSLCYCIIFTTNNFKKLQHVLTTRQTTQAAHKALALLTCTRSDCSPNVTKEINGHKPKGLKADNIDRSGSRYHLYYQNALALRVSHALNFTYVKSWQVPLHEEGRAQLKIFQKVTHIEAFI